MIHDMIGGGGGASLNFKVVGGTSTPASPKENTIWVNTDAEISSWAFSATEPEAPAAGMVWFATGTSSPVTFNALKKNNITVYPISAKQYVSGAWADKEAKSYQNGAWVDWWNGHLYEYGDQHEQVTGGWTNTGYKSSGYSTLNATFNTDNIYITGVNGVGPGGVATVNKIDLKGRTKLKMLFNADSVADTSFLVVLANKSDDMVNAPSAKASLTAGSQQTVSLDITAITEGYIGITSTRPTYIYDVWLE